jgi:3'-phosphoadenosine 5'-phosphosulfate sulfotransferase (PAPS reductase)/FAD synthetase
MKPGDKLYFVGRNHRPNREVTIEKVGVRWAKLDVSGWRLDMGCEYHNVYHDGYHVGQCWPSEKAWKDHTAKFDRWWEFRKRVANCSHVPDHLTLTDIYEIERRLRL